MGYTDYFNFDREPFSNAPNDRFYFASDQHNQALLRLKYSIDTDKGLAVLVGGVGTGKTTLARRMLDNLPVEKYESSLLVMIHSAVTPEWILSRICMQLGVKKPDFSPLKMLKQLYERLIEIEREGRKAVVLIDEAQMLQTREMMEEFRGLLNLEIPEKKLLNIVFFGLPELNDIMKLDEPLAQRVAFKYTLKPLSREDSERYIAYRLDVSGAGSSPFIPDCLPLIHRYSGGVPRLINTICDNALFEAFMRHDEIIMPGIISNVAEDLGLMDPEFDLATNQEPLEVDHDLDQMPEGFDTAINDAAGRLADDDDDLEIIFDEIREK